MTQGTALVAESLPVRVAPGTPFQQGRERTFLSVRVRVAFASILVLQGGATALAASQGRGSAGGAALVLGLAAMALTAATGYWLLRRLVQPLGPVTDAVARIGAGDLSGHVDGRIGGELQPLMAGLQQVHDKLYRVVSEVRTGTSNVAFNAAQMSRENDSLAQRTDTQADSLQETAASMEELTAAVRQNANTAQQANTLVGEATARAELGASVMRDVEATMDSIRASSHSIRDIIGVIDGIAFQTNILALNAAVEAARAGEQGRGFAVVAAEVRNLAQRSAEAARDVKALIGASVDKVNTGGARVDQAGKAMGEIVQAIRQVAELIRHIDAASREQSTGIDTISVAVSRIDSTTQDNAVLVKAAARTAGALHERAETLMRSVSSFRLGEAEHGTAQEAIDLVHRGCEYLRTQGRDALLADVNRLDAGRFVHRDLYLIVQNVGDAVFVAHGQNASRLGKSADVKDIDGKAFGLEFVRVAREKGEGWIDYKWVHPVTKEVFVKSGYAKRMGDLVLTCAIYKS
jgi:methyl-accepting chemotaxis protein